MRPLLVGLDNPHSKDPSHALWPQPTGSAGHRLYSMVQPYAGPGYSIREYVRDYDRINLYGRQRAKNGKGATATDKLLADLVLTFAVHFRYEVVVLLGNRVKAAFADTVPDEVEWMSWWSTDHRTGGESHTVWWLSIPHPSGRNHWYNDEGNRAIVGAALAQFRK